MNQFRIGACTHCGGALSKDDYYQEWSCVMCARSPDPAVPAPEQVKSRMSRAGGVPEFGGKPQTHLRETYD